MAVAFLALLGLCLLPAAWSIYKHKPLPEETLSEEIFTLLGWENVADINLETLHKRRKKEWRRTEIPPNPLRKGTPFDHSGGTFCFFIINKDAEWFLTVWINYEKRTEILGRVAKKSGRQQ